MASSSPSLPLNAEPDPSTLPALFDPVTVIQIVYKTIETHNILTTIFIPKNLLIPAESAEHPTTTTKAKAKAAPVLLRYHGGGMVTGAAIEDNFFAPWSVEFAVRHGAVVVMPDFRLLPEATIQEQNADVRDHFSWMHANLAAVVEKHTGGRVVPDLDRVLVSGDSAGGYTAVMNALDFPSKIRAVAVAYPMLDMRAGHFVDDYDKPLLGAYPQLPRSEYDAHVARVRAGELPSVVWADAAHERFALLCVIIQRGVYGDFFPDTPEGRKVLPLARIEDGERLPRGGVVVWHGKEDAIVPVEGSVKFKEILERVDPGLDVKVVLREGNHGFDIMPVPARLEEEWLEGALEGVVKAWLE